MLKKFPKGKVQSQEKYRKDKIKELVENQLLSQFGTRRIIKEIIQMEVNALFSKLPVNHEQIQKLKQRVLKLSKMSEDDLIKFKKEQPQEQQTCQINKENTTDNAQSTLENCEVQRTSSSFAKKSMRTRSEVMSLYVAESENADEWAILQKDAMKNFQLQQEKKQESELKKRKVFQQMLNSQVMEKDQKRRSQSMNEQVQEEEFKRALEEEEKAHQAKQEELRRQILNEREMRDEQIRLEQRKRKKEIEEEKKKDQELLEQIRQEIARENEEQQVKKLREREKFLEIIKENEVLRKKNLELIKQEKELEVVQQQEYLNQLRMNEQKREQEQQKRQDKITAFMKYYSQAVLNNQQDLEKKADQEYIKSTLEEDEKFKEQEKERKLRKYLEMRELQKFQQEQIEQKTRLKKKERLSNKEYINNSVSQSVEKLSEEQSQEQERKQRHMEHSRMLLSQISDKKSRSVQRRMSQSELRMNKSKLKELALQKGSEFRLKRIEVKL